MSSFADLPRDGRPARPLIRRYGPTCPWLSGPAAAVYTRGPARHTPGSSRRTDYPRPVTPRP